MADSGSVLKTILASSSVLVIGLLFRQGLGFFGRLFVARFLGRIDYGAVALGSTLLMTASVLVVLGMDDGVGRYLPRYSDTRRRRGILASAYGIVLPVATAVGLGAYLLAGTIATRVFGDLTLVPVLEVFSLTIPVAAFVRLTIGSVRGMQETLPRVYIENVTIPVVRFGLIVVVVVVGLGAVGIAWAYAVTYAIAAVFALYYLGRRTVLFSSVSTEPMYRNLLVFSAPLMVSSAMNMTLNNLDTLMIGFFSTTGDVGVYNVAYPLARLLQTSLIAFNFIYMPICSELHANGDYDELVSTYRIVSKWIFTVTLPVFLVLAFYPGLIIELTFGPDYVVGRAALSLLAMGFFVHAIAGPSGNTLMSIGRTRRLMYTDVLVVAVNIVLNVVLIPQYSFFGAALATLVSFLLMNGLYIAQIYAELGVQPITMDMVLPGVIAGMLWAGAYVTIRGAFEITFPAFALVTAAFVPVYAFVVLRFGSIEREEIKLLENIEEQLGTDLGWLRSLVRRFSQ